MAVWSGVTYPEWNCPEGRGKTEKMLVQQFARHFLKSAAVFVKQCSLNTQKQNHGAESSCPGVEIKDRADRVTLPPLWLPLPWLSEPWLMWTRSERAPEPTPCPIVAAQTPCHLPQRSQLPAGPSPMPAVSAGLNTNQRQRRHAEWPGLSPPSVRPLPACFPGPSQAPAASLRSSLYAVLHLGAPAQQWPWSPVATREAVLSGGGRVAERVGNGGATAPLPCLPPEPAEQGWPGQVQPPGWGPASPRGPAVQTWLSVWD